MKPEIKNEGLRKQRRVGEAWTFPEATVSRDGSGPAQLEGSPFQLHHIGVDLLIFGPVLTEGQTTRMTSRKSEKIEVTTKINR